MITDKLHPCALQCEATIRTLSLNMRFSHVHFNLSRHTCQGATRELHRAPPQNVWPLPLFSVSTFSKGHPKAGPLDYFGWRGGREKFLRPARRPRGQDVARRGAGGPVEGRALPWEASCHFTPLTPSWR